MTVTTDAEYLSPARKVDIYEQERDLARKRKEGGESKEGDFGRVLDMQRHKCAIRMSEAYADFVAREAGQFTG
jgi:hypothetical protein